jgi:hypothetical protein
MPIDALSGAVHEMLARISAPGWASGDTASTGFDIYSQPAKFIGPNLDCLGEASLKEHWDASQREAYDALRRIPRRYKLAVLAMARDEALNLPEWISHCLAIGAEHIFVYTNDNADGTDDLLRWFSQRAPVTPLFTTAAKGVNIQWKNYQHAFFLLPELRLYEWVLVIDVDEFPVPAERFNFHLPTLLDSAPADAGAVVFPWLWRLWDLRFNRSPGLLADRFEHALPHPLFKSATRLNSCISLCEVHIPTLDPHAKLVDSAFAEIQRDQVWSEEPKTRAGGWIDHFWGRSFEEFLTKKVRGDLLAIPTGEFRREFETYFSWTQSYSEANYNPMPAPVVQRMKGVLEKFQGEPTFTDLIERIDRRYEENASRIRSDREFVEIFNGFMSRSGTK